mgnify:CR=1 FL=1
MRLNLALNTNRLQLIQSTLLIEHRLVRQVQSTGHLVADRAGDRLAVVGGVAADMAHPGGFFGVVAAHVRHSTSSADKGEVHGVRNRHWVTTSSASRVHRRWPRAGSLPGR